MARPKGTAPIKEHLNLSVSAQTKAELAYIAAANQQSISQLLSDWAAKEARRVARRTGTPLPDAQQLKLY